MNADALQALQGSGIFASKSDSADYARAMLNILEDFSNEKERLEASQRAITNILEDFAGEKSRLEESQRASLNILEDFASEKTRLEETQRAMLNLLEDFDVERTKAEAASCEIRESYESLQAAKEATEALNRELESFSYSVSHDLRTPLRSVAGFSKVLLEDYSDRLDEQGRDYLGRIAAAAEKMGWLIDDLLKLSRLTRASMEHRRVDLSVMTRKIADRLKASQPHRSAEFILAEGITAHGDERLLMVMMDNLLGNAWKFTEKKERTVIEFGVKQDRGEATYFIRDNGVGLDMKYAGKLFQPFQRVHSPEEFAGTGIGLATVNRIINRHGGRVWIEGRLNEGATVYFTL